jgi:ankyrin repeat protein
LINYELCEAVKDNMISRCKELLDPVVSAGMTASINSKWLDDWTPLHIAANEGHREVLEVLLSCAQVADINAKSTMSRTPLHLAAMKNHMGVVVTLVNNGAGINACDNDGNTPLHLASQAGHASVVKCLLDHFPVISTNYAGRAQADLATYYGIYVMVVSYARAMATKAVSHYSRTSFHKVLLHNSRHDQVERLLRIVNSKPPNDKALELL